MPLVFGTTPALKVVPEVLEQLANVQVVEAIWLITLPTTNSLHQFFYSKSRWQFVLPTAFFVHKTLTKSNPSVHQIHLPHAGVL
jgi:hypothetical protein